MVTFDKYKKKFTEKAIQTGYSADEVNKCLDYAKPILEKNLPVIYNTSNLSALVGFNKQYLKRASAYPDYFYKEHIIPKKSGGVRRLYEPLPNLKDVQGWIAKNILNEIPISRYAKAYVYDRSIKDHVKFHDGQKVVLTLDIEKFFDNINLDIVEEMFLSFGYSKLVSNLMAKLCCFKKKLPQGAPTSPVISNIIIKPLDDILSEYCRAKELKYTRYADDLAFSGDKIEKAELESIISKTLRNLGGLKLNSDKTMIMRDNQRQTIAGIVVNAKTQVPREKRDELRQAMYYIEKFGLEDHLQKINCSKSNYIKHLLGIANYITFINPKDEKTKVIKEKLYKLVEADDL